MGDQLNVRGVLDTLSRELLAAGVPSEPSLAGGAAGIALAHARLGEVFPDRGHDDAAAHCVEVAAGALTTVGSPWLAEGRAGIGWVLAHLVEDDDGIHQAIVEAIRAALEREPAPFEWLYGAAGIAAYAVALGSERGAELGRAVTDALERRHATDGLWLTTPGLDRAEHPVAYASYGFAHGVPGVIGALAALVRAGLAGPRGASLLERGGSALAERARAAGAAGISATSVDTGACRLAWCYGDPAVAWSLLAASGALDSPALRQAGEAIARRAAARAPETAGVVDGGLCHGAAGLVVAFDRLHHVLGDPALASARDTYLARLFALKRSRGGASFEAWLDAARGWEKNDGLLRGTAGIALALASLDESDRDAGSLDWRALFFPGGVR